MNAENIAPRNSYTWKNDHGTSARLPRPVGSAKDRARVLRLISRLVVGGPAHNVCQLAASLREEGFETWLAHGVAAAGERPFAELARGLKIEPICVNSLRRRPSYRDVGAFFEVRSLLNRIQPEIVHTHTAKAGLIGRIAARCFASRAGRRPAIVHTFHGHVFDGYFGRRMSAAVVSLERALAYISDAIIVVSESVKSEIVNIYGIASADKVYVIPLGFDFDWLAALDDNRGCLRQRLGVGRDVLLIGMVGRLVPIKNHELAFNAFSEFLAIHHRDARLVLFGDGELRSILEARASALGIADKVVFVGWELDRARIYSDLDITCLTSLNEGTPVALIESLAAGVPVVATAVGGVPDVVNESTDGILVSAGDSYGIAEAIFKLCSRDDRVQRRRVDAICDKYSVKRLTSDTANLYREMLARADPDGAVWKIARPWALLGLEGGPSHSHSYGTRQRMHFSALLTRPEPESSSTVLARSRPASISGEPDSR
jgi:glycosyltransferase involved in cell wall biosynthesis